MRELTVKELATRERVTVRTVRNWIAKGAIDFRRTPGGGVRIPSYGEQTMTKSENQRKPSV